MAVENTWLRLKQALEKDPDFGFGFQLRLGEWLRIGIDHLAGRVYRLTETPGLNQRDLWLERKLDMDLVRRFAGLCDILESTKPREACPLAVRHVAEFAGTYGPLGQGALVKYPEEALPEQFRDLSFGYAEPVAYWLEESMTMRAALRLQDAIHVGRASLAGLRRHLLGTPLGPGRMSMRLETGWHTKIIPNFPPKSDSELQTIVELHEQQWAYMESFGMPLLSVDFRAAEEAWRRLEQQPLPHALTGPREVKTEEALLLEKSKQEALDQAEAELCGIIDHKLHLHVRARCINTHADALAVVPINLLGALYLQLARSIADPSTVDPSKQPVRCTVCGKLIPGRERQRAQNYCSNKCRSRASRDRKRTA
jgi:predicted nucleic acid-binding Zn ribbon protein